MSWKALVKNLTAVCLPMSVLLLGFGGAAMGGVITFDNLTGANGDPFANYTEGGFTVGAPAGDWSKAFNYGNPLPDVFSSPRLNSTPATLEVANGGLFTFGGADLSSNNGTTNYAFEGFLAGNPVFNQTGSDSTSDTFITVPSSNSGVQMDSLFIILAPGSSAPSSYNVDNINVTAVGSPTPEPGSGLLFATALLGGLGLWRRSRRAAASI